MIWLILAALLVLVLAFVLAPLRRAGEPDTGEPLAEARLQLARLESDLAAGRIGAEVAAQTRRALELRVLDLLNRRDADLQTARGEPSIRLVQAIAALVLVAGSLGLYMLLGQSGYDRTAPATLQDQPLETLVVTLQRRLERDPNPPLQGYVLLARSLMTLQRYDEAFAAYEAALALAGEDLQLRGEYERAQAYAIIQARAPGLPALDEGAIAAAETMTEAERTVMIASMVEGLATRLAANPDDGEGWARLIRARVVLGQTARAQADVASAMAALEGDADQQASIAELATGLGLTPG